MSQPNSSDVHVNAPLGSREDEIIKAAFGAEGFDGGFGGGAPAPTAPPAIGENSAKRREYAANLQPAVNNLEAEIIKAAFLEPVEYHGKGNMGGAADKLKELGVDHKEFERRRAKLGVKKSFIARAVDAVKSAIKKANATPRRVSTVAVTHGDHLLMGKRRDNGKWTVPGGHVNPGEDFHDGGLRELAEESGIEADELTPLGGVHKAAPDLHVQPYHLDLTHSGRPRTSMKEDPDGEVNRWHWVNMADGLPDHIAENLHVPFERNCLLQRVLKEEDDEGGDDLDPELDARDGIRLDLGSGQNREPNHLGVDLYPYDAATLCHDVSLPLPFPDGCARSIRAVNTPLEGVTHEHLMSEAHRLLKPGGTFHFEGPEPIDVDHDLEETDREVVEKDGDTPAWARQSFQKSEPDAATANDADPSFPGDKYPADALNALESLGYYWSDATTSAAGNAAMGYPSQGAVRVANSVKKSAFETLVPIAKADSARQIIYCVVLAPEESDLQTDIMLAPDIEETAHNYLRDSRLVGSEHTNLIKAYPVESFIAPVDFDWPAVGDHGPQRVKAGSWVIAIKITDPVEWQKVVDGEYQGVSVGGFGLRDEIA
jgi:8-oxo-dGTP pyrophosphatase MutT (NUDIX family)